MTDFITHEGTEPPKLAPAAWIAIKHPEYGVIHAKVGGLIWEPGREYLPLTNDEGHKLISAEGLHSEVEWVFVTKDGECIQSLEKPEPWENGEGWIGWKLGQDAPSSHRHPGDWRDSLYRVEGR